MNDIALFISPYTRWGITTAQLNHYSLLGPMVESRGAISSISQEDVLFQLVSLVQSIQPLALYDLAGKKVFRTPAVFWEKADKQIQQYVKKVSDQRLAKVISKAAELDIPIFYRQHSKDVLRIEQRLSPADFVPQPHMLFRRVDGGIEYSLTLKLGDDVIIPSQHSVTVITASPGIVCIDHKLYRLDEHFSGKLLLPFQKKDIVVIPQKMERDYFHTFILHNVATADVEVEGFELTDIHPQPLCRLVRSTDVFGRHILSIDYQYGRKCFVPSAKETCYVTIEDNDGDFHFTRIQRDAVWEKSCHTYLEQCTATVDGVNMYQNYICFDSLPVIIEWLKANAPQLRQNGFCVEQPSEETYYLGALDLRESVSRSGDWLMLHSDIVLDDGRVVPFMALKNTILSGQKEYVMMDGTRLIIPDEWLKRYTPFVISGAEEADGLRIHKTLYAASVNSHSDDTDDTVSSEDSMALLDEQQQSFPLPLQLKATLRSYQLSGYQWLANHLAHLRGCCLGDEMGLGKTVQTIALLLHYKEISMRQEKPKAVGMLFSEEEMMGIEDDGTVDGKLKQYSSLIVVPTSLVHNWQNELQQFAPSLSVMVYTGSPEDRRKKRLAMSVWDVIITTYRTLVNDIAQLSPLQYGIIVFDECQAFKNRDSQIHKAVVKLQGQCRMGLSGTPVENGIQELWSLFHVISPSVFGSYATFSGHYLNSLSPSLEEVRTETLRRIISPYMLKRKKEAVLSDLPERQDELIVCPMTQEQESLYASELSLARNSVMDEESHQSIHVLAAIQRLRQIACHPKLVTSASDTSRSGKMDEVFMRLESIVGTQHKVLLFSEYVGFLRIISAEMDARGWKHAVLTGETQQREQVISDFQNDAECQFFLISLKAGGVGLNLTQADYVFILDPWWNITAEEQAISRAHRIGQRNAVFVYRFVSEGTLEEQILTLQADKQAIIDKVLFN